MKLILKENEFNNNKEFLNESYEYITKTSYDNVSYLKFLYMSKNLKDILESIDIIKNKTYDNKEDIINDMDNIMDKWNKKFVRFAKKHSGKPNIGKSKLLTILALSYKTKSVRGTKVEVLRRLKNLILIMSIPFSNEYLVNLLSVSSVSIKAQRKGSPISVECVERYNKILSPYLKMYFN